MLPESLQSSYKSYKQDTNRFAAWLLATAVQCGHNQPKQSATPPVAYKATTKELLNFTSVIAGSGIPIPQHILEVAKRAIRTRKEVTAWFSDKGSSPQNEKHSHFVAVLEEICNRLEGNTDRSSKRDTRKASSIPEPQSDERRDRSLNIFAALALEDDLETMSTESEPIEPSAIKVEFAEEEDATTTNACLSHWLFRALCLLRDLCRIREFIAATWAEFRGKEIDLMNAAAVTEVALKLSQELVKNLEDAALSLSISAVEIQDNIYGLSVADRGGSMTLSHEDGQPYNNDMADLCYLPAKAILDTFAGFLGPAQVHAFQKGSFGTYSPKADREQMTPSQKFEEDKTILLAILPEICIIDEFKLRMPSVDTITRCLVEFSKSGDVTMFVSFASQIFLDIHHILRDSASSAFADLRMSGMRILKTVEEYFQLSATLPQPIFWPKEADQEIRDISSIVQSWIEQDAFQDARDFKKDNMPGDILGTHFLVSQHALLCGIILFDLNVRMHSVGYQLVNQWYHIPQLAFLQNLVMLCPIYKDLKWPDMDAFLKIHGESCIFVGSRPKNPEESLNRLELAKGISSAVNFARNSRGRDHEKKINRKVRTLKPTAPVTNMLFHQELGYANDSGLLNIEGIWNELSKEFKPEISGNKPSNESSEVLIPQSYTLTHRFDPRQLLSLLKAKLFEEEPLVMYNYFGMHRRAIELLRLIRAKEHEKFVECFTPGYMPDESCLSTIVLYIHYIVRSASQGTERMGLLSHGAFALGQTVISVGDVMRRYLKKNGDIASKELRVFCKNKKPLQDDTADDNHDQLLRRWFKVGYNLGNKDLASLQTGIPIV